MRKLGSLVNDFEKDSEHSEEKKVLTIRDLLEVQGGLDMEGDMMDCSSGQCHSMAVVTCTSGVFK